ncbi:MAG: hypothetical protein AAFW60_04025 [Pseudomonadota bacterium]
MTKPTKLVLSPLPHEWDGPTLVRQCEMKLIQDGVVSRSETLFFEFDCDRASAPDEEDCDAYLTTLVLDAMHYGVPVEVQGSVSQGLLENLFEFQAIWARWFPELFQPVDIECRASIARPRENENAMVAFSGGLDAMFTLWRHATKQCGPRSQNITHAIMVHGFDIPLSAQSRFDYAKMLAANALEELQIDLREIRCNYRELSTLPWNHTHGVALVGAMMNLGGIAGRCLIGSSHVYETLRHYGSSPISDHLLSSDRLRVMHDGASHNRTQKAHLVSEWQAGTDNLRVCWEGENNGNCGKCEKCLRTGLNFLANGCEIPGALQEKLSLKKLRKVTLYNIGYIRMWQQLLDTARRNDIQENWVKQLRFIVLKSRLRLFLKGPSY